MPKALGQLKKLKEEFEKVFLIKDEFIVDLINALYISHFIKGDPIWVVIVAESASGKCLGKGTPILMYDGSIKQVEEIKTGDLLMGDDSSPRKVLKTTQGKEELFLIKQTRGDDYVVNKSHILSLKQTNKHITYKKYKKGSVIDVPLVNYLKQTKTFRKNFRGYKVGVDFESKPITVDPYFLGIWLGDGRRDSVSISTPDKEIVNFLYKFAEDNNLKISTKKYGSKCPAYYLGSKKYTRPRIKSSINSAIESYDLMPKKFIPQDYKTNSRNVRLQILAGLLDTDGDLGKNNKGFNFTSKDKQLAQDVVFISRSLGLHSSTKRKLVQLPKSERVCTYWRVYIGGNIDIIPTKVKRKQAIKKNRLVDSTTTTIKTKSLGNGEYFGFTIDGNGRFLLGDFTVTHNTEFINALSTCKCVHPLSTLTANTFISGAKLGGGQPASLLHQLSKDVPGQEMSGIITFKDLTSLISENEVTRTLIMAQLREIYDGKYDKQFGTGQKVKWAGKVTVIAASTFSIHRLKQQYTSMGERFLFYNLIQPDRKEASKKSMTNQESGNMLEMRNHIAEMVRVYQNELIEIPEELPHITEEMRNDMIDVAELTTRARSDVARNWRSPTKDILEVYPPEMPTRVAASTQTLVRSLMILNWNETGEMVMPEKYAKLVHKINLDSIAPNRRHTLQELSRYATITTPGLAIKMDLPTTTVRIWLEDLVALGIVKRIKTGTGNKGDEWRIKDEYRQIIQKFDGIEDAGESLTEDSAEIKETLLAEAEEAVKGQEIAPEEMPF